MTIVFKISIQNTIGDVSSDFYFALVELKYREPPITAMRVPTIVEKTAPCKGRRKSIETVKNHNLVVAVAVSVGHDDGSARGRGATGGLDLY